LPGSPTTNGIEQMVARVFKGERVETQELCVDDVCVTRDQFAEVFGGSQSAAAAGAGSVGGGPAPASLPASGDADTASTTPPTDSSGPVDTAGSQDTHTEAADGAPGLAEAESGQPTVAPQDDSATTVPVPAEDGPEAEELEEADNPPLPDTSATEQLPATGTE
jgi:hypothetical protein